MKMLFCHSVIPAEAGIQALLCLLVKLQKKGV